MAAAWPLSFAPRPFAFPPAAPQLLATPVACEARAAAPPLLTDTRHHSRHSQSESSRAPTACISPRYAAATREARAAVPQPFFQSKSGRGTAVLNLRERPCHGRSISPCFAVATCPYPHRSPAVLQPQLRSRSFRRHLRRVITRPFTEGEYDNDLRREVRANYGVEGFDVIYGG